jgi:hypothetical protein
MSSTHSRNGTCIQIFIEKLEKKIPLQRPKLGRDNNIKMALEEVGCEELEWIHVAQDAGQRIALVNTVMDLRVS